MRHDARLRDFYHRLRTQSTFTYIAFGDSHTFGSRCQGFIDTYGAGQLYPFDGSRPKDEWNSFANLLHRRLQSVRRDVSFINSGICGDGTANAATRVAADVTAHNPDIVTVNFGTNDCVGGLAVATYKSNLQTIIDDIVGSGATCILMTPIPFAQTSLTYGWWGPVQLDPTYPLSDYVSAVQELAASNDLVLADAWNALVNAYYGGLSAHFWLTWEQGATAPVDSEHPGELGHRMYYQALERAIFGQREV